MVDSQGDQEALTRAIERFSDKADRLLGVGNMNTARIEVNAGGAGIWIACTLCIVMFTVNIGLLAMFINHDRKIDDLNSYLNAIYMLAPHLKPEAEKEDTN